MELNYGIFFYVVGHRRAGVMRGLLRSCFEQNAMVKATLLHFRVFLYTTLHRLAERHGKLVVVDALPHGSTLLRRCIDAMRVIVCGGREYTDRDMLFAELDAVKAELGITVIISGCARGADTLGLEWAEARGIECARFPADWERHRRAAGPIRNQQMLDEGKPDLVIAFPGGRGTTDMVRRATEAGIKVIVLSMEVDIIHSELFR